MTPVRLLTLSGETLERLAAALPQFRTMLDDRIAQHDFRNIANVPADIDQELLPAGAAAQQSVSDAQVDQTEDEVDEADLDAPFAEGRPLRQGSPPSTRALHPADRRDGLRRRVPGDGLSRLWTARQPRAHSPARAHRLDGTSLRAICRAGEELGLAARAVKASTGHLDQMPLPAIIHWEATTGWCCTTSSGRTSWIVDPALGQAEGDARRVRAKWSGYAALFDYTELRAGAEATRRLAWLWPFFRPLLGPAAARRSGSPLIVSALQMVFPVFTQMIVDRVLVEQDVALLNLLIVGMARGAWSSSSARCACSATC